VLFILEDLHWVDPTTLEFLDLLLDQASTSNLLVLLTHRPEFQSPWESRAYLTQITLNRLSRAHIAQMVIGVTGGKKLPDELLNQIVDKSDGVPLVVEELTKTLLELGHLTETNGHYQLTQALPTLAIPATLHDSLMARLDRLSSAKGLAQLGAVIGRQFSYALLEAISSLEASMLQRELGKLVEVELVYQHGLPPQATYTFKHALIQEAAYQSLLRSTRQQYHQRIAQVLAERFSETAETQPELLAHHFTEAGLYEQALGYWQRAGQLAIKRSSPAEAISHLTMGLEVLSTLPVTPEHTQHELLLQHDLGTSLMAIKGYAAPEVESPLSRARELCQQVGETPQLFPVLWGLWAFYLVRAELQTARELGEQLMHLAQSVHDPALVLEAHYALGHTLFWLGELDSATRHFEQSLALYDPQQHSSLVFLYGEDARVTSLSFLSWALWFLGYPDQALRMSYEAVTIARELSHAYSLAFALLFPTRLHQLRREIQATQERAEELTALSNEQGFAFWAALATILRGWALTEQGQREEGMVQLHQGLATYASTGARLPQASLLALRVEVCGKARQAEEELRVVAEALAAAHQSGEACYEAELYRLKGELLLRQESTRQKWLEAEAYFQQALEVARRQQAKSLELRAAMSLARLWQSQGRRQDAYDLLAPVYGWFTEGFDTADLLEAKQLLDELAA
jgi:predicted ATPase